VAELDRAVEEAQALRLALRPLPSLWYSWLFLSSNNDGWLPVVVAFAFEGSADAPGDEELLADDDELLDTSAQPVWPGRRDLRMSCLAAWRRDDSRRSRWLDDDACCWPFRWGDDPA
jgi:hypothetical protein